MQPKFHIRSGDRVQIIGGKNKGKEGKILKVITNTHRAIVEGQNIVTKYVKPNANKPEGGEIKIEAPIHISNLMLIDPKSGKPTRIGRKLVDGKLKRYAKKTGEIIKNE